LFLVASVLANFPHYIPYFNELVLDGRLKYRILADSNLEWGQSGRYFDQYHAENPDLIIEPVEPVAGRVVVNANNLVGITAKPETFAWLRENFTPAEAIAHTILVFDLSEEEVSRLREK
jgi:hypothetical protein